MRTLARLFFVAVLVSALMPPVPVHANAYEIEIEYYTGCGSLTLVGTYAKSCDGFVTAYGVQNGHWKLVSMTNCVNETVTTSYYENCGGTWYPVSAAAFGGACSC